VKRREFLRLLGLGGAAVLRPSPFPDQPGRRAEAAAPRELRTEVVVAGGGLGGVAAALAACRAGRSVVMTEETDWIGGQLTQQAVPPDEHPWIESFGSTGSYRDLRERIRSYYRRNYPLSPAARREARLNPGNGDVSSLCCEPRVALAALSEMLAPWVSAGRLAILLEHRAVGAESTGDRVGSLTVRDLRSGAERMLRAPYFIDATELGDLLPLSGTEHVLGAESRKETGEPHAGEEPRPRNQQAFTACFAMDHLPGEDHRIDRPADYDFWRAYFPKLSPPWPGPLLSWNATHPVTGRSRAHGFDPGSPARGAGGLWTYRRIADRKLFEEGAYRSDICLVNWPQNDYLLGNLSGVAAEEAESHRRRARELSLALLYWLQTEAPRRDGGTGWPGLRLRPDLVGTADGLAKHVYVRESRRIRAEFTVLEEHVGTEARRARAGKGAEEVTAERFPDSVGVGSYRIDLHPSSLGDNYLDLSSLPFQIPLGALLPRRVENLLPGAKNLGVTHITNGCYRLHPVEWNVGEAAGALAAFSLLKGEPPRRIRNHPPLLEEFQRLLRKDGVELEWPRLLPR
jgi:hypothetical protein